MDMQKIFQFMSWEQWWGRGEWLVVLRRRPYRITLGCIHSCINSQWSIRPKIDYSFLPRALSLSLWKTFFCSTWFEPETLGSKHMPQPCPVHFGLQYSGGLIGDWLSSLLFWRSDPSRSIGASVWFGNHLTHSLTFLRIVFLLFSISGYKAFLPSRRILRDWRWCN